MISNFLSRYTKRYSLPVKTSTDYTFLYSYDCMRQCPLQTTMRILVAVGIALHDFTRPFSSIIYGGNHITSR